ncbi:hypothetical protein F511_31565 [Dorcoceras hygrometricum]|uniref:Uncharacterized protein n=1 Tax=Dorcoceras hygrometricum TaxID=472368 RepID=A0A2Z7B301_9LAMI|nr:hypothetical protein F511_31565 [Dorcoceras hygrometricum]
MNKGHDTQQVCFWKFGPQCPTSPLLPPRKDPLEDLIYNSCTDPPTQAALVWTPRLLTVYAMLSLLSKKIERMKAKKQQAREPYEVPSKVSGSHLGGRRLIQQQHLIIEPLVEEKASLLQTIQGNRRSDSNNGGEGSSNSRGGLSREDLMAIATIVATTLQGLVNTNHNQAPPPTPPSRGTKYYYESLHKNKAPLS